MPGLLTKEANHGHLSIHLIEKVPLPLTEEHSHRRRLPGGLLWSGQAKEFSVSNVFRLVRLVYYFSEHFVRDEESIKTAAKIVGS